jgi:hypothetical protein
VIREELKRENLKVEPPLSSTHYADDNLVQLRGRPKKEATLDGSVRHLDECPALRDVSWLCCHRFNRRKSRVTSAVEVTSGNPSKSSGNRVPLFP